MENICDSRIVARLVELLDGCTIVNGIDPKQILKIFFAKLSIRNVTPFFNLLNFDPLIG